MTAAGSFKERFCAQYGVPPDRFEPTVLRIVLYPHARWLADLSAPAFLAPDRRFIAAVGRTTRWRSFAAEAYDFQHSADNRRFWRRRLRLRVSIARMRVLFSDVMGGREAGVEAESPSARGEEEGGPNSLATS